MDLAFYIAVLQAVELRFELLGLVPDTTEGPYFHTLQSDVLRLVTKKQNGKNHENHVSE